MGGTNWVGRRVPYETTANGKVLQAFNSRTADGKAIRDRGYASAVDELEEGLAALSISGPTLRLTRERIMELAPQLITQAAQVSERLGHHDKRGAA